MVAAGLLDTSSQHAEAVTNMAFDMRRAAAQVTTPHTNESIQVMIGTTHKDKGGAIGAFKGNTQAWQDIIYRMRLEITVKECN